MRLQDSLHSFLSNQESPDRHQQPSANGRTGLLAPKLELIGEDETMDTYDLYDPYGDNQSERGDMDFLEVELVRSMFIDSFLNLNYMNEDMIVWGHLVQLFSYLLAQKTIVLSCVCSLVSIKQSTSVQFSSLHISVFWMVSIPEKRNLGCHRWSRTVVLNYVSYSDLQYFHQGQEKERHWGDQRLSEKFREF